MIRKTKGEYRTKSGKSYFRFSFEKQGDGEVNIFVIDQPSYKDKPSNYQMTHRRMKNGKICIDISHNPKTMADAFKLAKHWSEKTEHYVNTGTFTMEETGLLDKQRQGHYKEPTRRLRISEEALEEIRDFIGEHPAERGGMLGRDADKVIRHFKPDYTGRCTAGAYDPDIKTMNRVIKEWKKEGIEFCGFGHSHPAGVLHLSSYDKWYAGEILGAFKKLEKAWFPLIMTKPDTGRFEIIPYAAIPGTTNRKQCSIVKTTLSVVDDLAPSINTKSKEEVPTMETPQKPTDTPEHKDSNVSDVQTKKTKAKKKACQIRYYGNFDCLWQSSRLNPSRVPNIDIDVSKTIPFSVLKTQKKAEQLRNSYLSRISGEYDIKTLDSTRLIVIGTGGGASLIRNCGRMAFGEEILIDPDVLSKSNVASQQADPSAIGCSKVEALAQDAMKINPAAAVLAITEPIENIDDKMFELLIKEPLRIGKNPKQTILLVLTDNFEAQARGHRLGLHFGLPTICAQEYMRGIGAEVTYTIPGVTPACHRCITASRYKAYLENNYQNDVTSEGAPIFAAEFLNAVLGHILLGVVFHGSNHPRWGEIITRLQNKNLLRLRMDPDFDKYFGDTFGRRHEGAKGRNSLFMLDSLFLPQTPDCGQSEARPTCPDCHGSGDLKKSIRTFKDTRIMRKVA